MKNFYFGIHLFLSLFLFDSTVSFSQSENENEIHKVYDDLVGIENTKFYNGPEFKDEFPNASGDSRYFNHYSFSDSNIEYGGQLYSNVPLEYDIFSDKVITRSNTYLSNFIVQLIPEYISNFTINDHDFVKLTDYHMDDIGFYEVVSVGDSFKLYIKHIRKYKKRTVGFTVQHSFTNENYYLVHYNDTYHIINSIKDLKKVVPNRYKEVQKYRKDYKSLYKADINNFMIKLIEYLNGR